MLALAAGIAVFLLVRSNLFWWLVVIGLIASMLPAKAETDNEIIDRYIRALIQSIPDPPPTECDRPIAAMTPAEFRNCLRQSRAREERDEQMRRAFQELANPTVLRGNSP